MFGVICPIPFNFNGLVNKLFFLNFYYLHEYQFEDMEVIFNFYRDSIFSRENFISTRYFSTF